MKDSSVGDIIKAQRKRLGISQLDLELEIDAASGSISRIENGLVNPTKETLKKISHVFHLDSVQEASLFGVNNLNLSIDENSTPNLDELYQQRRFMELNKLFPTADGLDLLNNQNLLFWAEVKYRMSEFSEIEKIISRLKFISEDSFVNKADFNIHYTDLTALETIRKAKEKQLQIISLVRRSEISDLLSEYVDFGKQIGIEVISGLEYVISNNELKCGILCLGFDSQDNIIRKYFGKPETEEKSAQIAQRQKHFLENECFTFNYLLGYEAELLSNLLAGKITEKAIRFCQLAVRSGENENRVNQLMAENYKLWEAVKEEYQRLPGYFGNMDALKAKFLWKLYFDLGKPGSIRTGAHWKEVINAIHNSGGIALYLPDKSFEVNTWRILVDGGIDGVLAWHGDKVKLDKETIKKIKKSGLLVLGGSDYDPYKKTWPMSNSSMIEYPGMYKEFIAYLNKMRSKKNVFKP